MFVDGVRTPFQKQYSGFQYMDAHELSIASVKELVKRTGINKDAIDYHVANFLYQDPRLPNAGRDVVVLSDLPHKIPSHTVSQVCNGGIGVIATACNSIVSGQNDVVLVSGSELLSNIPVWFSKTLKVIMDKKGRAKTDADYREISELLKTLNIKSIQPETFMPMEYITQMLIGEYSEKDFRRLNLEGVNK